MHACQGRLHTCWRAYLGVPGSAGGRATPGGSGGCAASWSSLLAFPRPPVWAPPASIPPSLPCPAFILQAAVHALSHATCAHSHLCLFWGQMPLQYFYALFAGVHTLSKQPRTHHVLGYLPLAMGSIKVTGTQTNCVHPGVKRGTYVLSRPAFVLAPVAVESFPRLLAEDQSHLRSRAATACKASATTTRHPSARIVSCHPDHASKLSASGFIGP